MDYTNIIGEKIKSLRSIKEISIEELAESTGLSTDQITRIEENVDIPSLAPLIKIARALGVRLGTFLDDQDSESGPRGSRRHYQFLKQCYRLTPAHALSLTFAQQD